MKANILGTKYKIIYKDFFKDETLQKNSFVGYCDSVDKVIVICNMNTFPEWKNEPPEKCKKAEQETLRHEIIHAFLNESGLSDSALCFEGGWTKNEEMIDFFAIQFPKIKKVYKKLKIM